MIRCDHCSFVPNPKSDSCFWEVLYIYIYIYNDLFHPRFIRMPQWSLCFYCPMPTIESILTPCLKCLCGLLYLLIHMYMYFDLFLSKNHINPPWASVLPLPRLFLAICWSHISMLPIHVCFKSLFLHSHLCWSQHLSIKTPELLICHCHHCRQVTCWCYLLYCSLCMPLFYQNHECLILFSWVLAHAYSELLFCHCTLLHASLYMA